MVTVLMITVLCAAISVMTSVVISLIVTESPTKIDEYDVCPLCGAPIIKKPLHNEYTSYACKRCSFFMVRPNDKSKGEN